MQLVPFPVHNHIDYLVALDYLAIELGSAHLYPTLNTNILPDRWRQRRSYCDSRYRKHTSFSLARSHRNYVSSVANSRNGPKVFSSAKSSMQFGYQFYRNQSHITSRTFE